MEYRCVATSVEGFVQQLAVSFITHGYWFYVTETVPEGKDPAAVDAKLIDRYGIAISKWARCRRKKQGLANMQYLRHGRFFVLLATKGRHEFFEREKAMIRDVRRKSIKFGGYSIGCRKGRDGRWHVSVRMSAHRYQDVRGLVECARTRPQAAVAERVVHSLARVQFGPVCGQLYQLVMAARKRRKVNQTRVAVKICQESI